MHNIHVHVRIIAVWQWMTGGLRPWAVLVGAEQVAGLMLEGWAMVWMEMLHHWW